MVSGWMPRATSSRPGAGSGQADTPETHAFWKEFSAHVRQEKPDAVLVGENWSTTPIVATYYGSTATVPGGDELPLNFNFRISEQILAGLNGNNAAPIAAKLAEMARVYPAGVSDAPFLTNHDMVRVATQLGGNAGKVANAAALLLTLPGRALPLLRRGAGHGERQRNNDESKRTPMPWDGTAGGGFTTGTPWYSFSGGYTSGRNVAAQGNAAGLAAVALPGAHPGPACLGGAEPRRAQAALSPTQGTRPCSRSCARWGRSGCWWCTTSRTTTCPRARCNLPGTTPEVLFADSNVSALTKTASGWQASLPPRTTGIWRLKP